MLIVNKNFTEDDTTFTTVLEGVNYYLRVRWNPLSESWFLYFGTNATEPLFKTRMSVNRDLLLPVKWNSDIPQGMLFVWDAEKVYGRPTRDTLGVDRRFKLMYFTQEELESVQS